MQHSVNSHTDFHFFTERCYSKFAAKRLLKIPLHLICVAALRRGTLMSENERQLPINVVINDKLQGKVVTYLRCGGIVNNQLRILRKVYS